MANLLEDIQCASSDTRPPMLDRTDFASWQQCIRNEGALHFGTERPRAYSNLSPEEKERYNVDIRAINILLQGLPKDIYTLISRYTDAKGHMGYCKDAPGRVVVQNVQGRQNKGQGNNVRGAGVAGYGGAQNRVGMYIQ
nr:hypothetical protein [Tanacetum cinerariifolium]